MRAAVAVPVAAMAQVATQTRTKLVPNIGLLIYHINLYLRNRKLFWHMDPILQSLSRPLPFKEYITAAEVACQSLKPSEADEFRADIARILKQARPSKPNISKEEWKAIKELRTDKDCLVLTADKGVALVVIDKKDYTKKMNQLLEDQNTYRLLKMDPTNKQKNRLINILRRIKSEGRLEESTYKKMYPTGASSPKLYGLPKIHKKEIPWGPLPLVKALSLMGWLKS